nr:NAD(P)-binding protein [uncultured Dongia sp.]
MRPVVVAGGGLAGSATACLLARAGHPVQLIERDRAPRHKVCGEFLSCEAQGYLGRLGIDLAGLGAVPITHLRLARRDKVVTAKLPFLGRSLSRQVLDEALLRRAEELGADVLRGHSIREISDSPLSLSVDGIGDISPETLLLASGKHDVRGASREARAQANDLIGLKSYFRLAPAQHNALRHHVEIILFKGGYAGLQMVEGNRANLCLLVRRARFAAVDHDWQGLLASLMAENTHLSARLTGATDMLDRPLAIARIPYGFLHRPAPGDAAGLFRLGDQLAVTPSFSGDGMSIALHTAFAAVDAYLTGYDANAYHHRMRQEIGPQIRRAKFLSAGMQNDVGQAGIMALAGMMPSLLQGAAAITRLPDTAARLHFR